MHQTRPIMILREHSIQPSVRQHAQRSPNLSWCQMSCKNGSCSSSSTGRRWMDRIAWIISQHTLAATKRVVGGSFVFQQNSLRASESRTTVKLLQRKTLNFLSYGSRQPRSELHWLQDLGSHNSVYMSRESLILKILRNKKYVLWNVVVSAP